MDLWLRCYTLDEISDAVGCTRDLANDVCCRIQEHEISNIPGIFTEDAPEESDPDAVKSPSSPWMPPRDGRFL
jgi:hypothetical protein